MHPLPDFELCEVVNAAVCRWSEARPDIRGLVLLGSYARGNPRADSDIDLLCLADDPAGYRSTAAWVDEIAWPAPVVAWRDATYGVTWSRHCELKTGLQVELGFAQPSWAACDPIDPGTFYCMNDACRILYDPAALLSRLRQAVARQAAARNG